METQEFLDTLVDEFVINKRPPSIDPTPGAMRCLYRQEIGQKKKVLKCAVGLFIPLNLWREHIGKGFKNQQPFGWTAPEIQAIFQKIPKEIVLAAQNAHDNAAKNAKTFKNIEFPTEFYKLLSKNIKPYGFKLKAIS